MNARHTPPVPPSGRGLGWPIGIACLLAATVGMNVFMYRLANDDPSFAVEPDYYARAVHWDDELAQRRHNSALGWHARAAITTGGDGVGELRVRLTDSTGASLDGASVSAEAFPVARASQVSRLTLPAVPARRGADGAELSAAGSAAAAGAATGRAVAPAGEAGGEGGSYAAPLVVTQGGRWELRLTVTRGGERFTSVERLELPR